MSLLSDITFFPSMNQVRLPAVQDRPKVCHPTERSAVAGFVEKENSCACPVGKRLSRGGVDDAPQCSSISISGGQLWLDGSSHSAGHSPVPPGIRATICT